MGNSQIGITRRVIVIGGGPAGMLAAGTAAKYGAQVILLERNTRLGKKLGVTGHERCNLTNAERDIRSFISTYGQTGKFLYSALTEFSNQDTIRFFESLGIPTKTETDGRVFPQSDDAADIITALQRYLMQNKVQIICNIRVSHIRVNDNQVIGVKTEIGQVYPAKSVILCTGGKSYTGTGSTGDGYKIATELGHTIIPLHPALVPIEIAESWVKSLPGLALNKINLRIIRDNKTIKSVTGDLLFTHFGISGPIVLDCSEKVGELLLQGPVFISLDLFPQYTVEQLDTLILNLFKKHFARQVKNVLSELIINKLVPIILNLQNISPQGLISQFKKADRQKLVKTLKNIRMTVTKLRSLEEGMITAGGVSLKEINFQTMESNLISGLYFTGEIIDITGKTGGYNLQMAFSTGYVAGLNAVKRIG